MSPDFFLPYLIRGAVRAQLGDGVGARRDQQHSLQLCPTVDGHYMLGQVDRIEGDRQPAIQHYRIAANSNSPAGKAATRELINLACGL